LQSYLISKTVRFLSHPVDLSCIIFEFLSRRLSPERLYAMGLSIYLPVCSSVAKMRTKHDFLKTKQSRAMVSLDYQ